ncbi:sulfatase [Haloarcula sp. 1CSR25-25]|uniref:sulfatase n=1 Tax=Haloarcula sp. 1CSR25-25 TaxID=2862545 RepID=UPI002895F6D0|nr:sulfatase [Haloarcula sp. 1CSR25-25]MDT3435470.1 sulfatase [Haloarcula sp. 1CSR25-25]
MQFTFEHETMETPNVVLVTVDCLRYDRCGFNGHGRNTTPVLDALANESFVFDNAYSTGPYTTESFPGILAGQHSYNGAHYGNHLAWKALPTTSPTLGTYFQDHGYRTIATLTNPHLTQDRNFDRGFDQYQNLRTDGQGDAGSVTWPGEIDQTDLMYDFRSRMRTHGTLVNPYTLPYMAYRYYQYLNEWPSIDGTQVMSQYLANLEDAGEPFFGWTHLMDLHAPISPNTIREGGLAKSNSVWRHLLSDAARVSWIYEPACQSIYDSALRYVDNRIGELISALRARKQWEETVLIVTGDHGEVLFDRDGIYGHPRHHLFDELLHVPLLVRVPGCEGTRIDNPVSLAWIHELLAEILEFNPGAFPARSQSDSLLEDSTGDSAKIISDSLDGAGQSTVVRDDRYKLLTHSSTDGEADRSYEFMEQDIVYRYATDAGERVPLASSTAPELGDIARELEIHPGDHPSIDGDFDPAVEQHLRDLGYKM